MIIDDQDLHVGETRVPITMYEPLDGSNRGWQRSGQRQVDDESRSLTLTGRRRVHVPAM